MLDAIDRLPDWLSLLVAVLSLGGGAGVGVYRGGVQRARLDDRREILRGYFPWARYPIVNEPSPFTNDPDVPPEVNVTSRAAANFFAMNEINSLVRMLPWKDRALWVRDLSILLHASSETTSLYHALEVARPYQWSGRIGENELRASAEIVELFRKARLDIDSKHGPRFVNRASRFEAHLLRKVNPTGLSRFQDLSESVKLIVRGPRPFSASIRPVMIETAVMLSGQPAVGSCRDRITRTPRRQLMQRLRGLLPSPSASADRTGTGA